MGQYHCSCDDPSNNQKGKENKRALLGLAGRGSRLSLCHIFGEFLLASPPFALPYKAGTVIYALEVRRKRKIGVFGT